MYCHYDIMNIVKFIVLLAAFYSYFTLQFQTSSTLQPIGAKSFHCGETSL